MASTALPSNSAAWLPGRLAQLELKDAPYTRPGADQIVVRAHAVAVNPLDWITQAAGDPPTAGSPTRPCSDRMSPARS